MPTDAERFVAVMEAMLAEAQDPAMTPAQYKLRDALAMHAAINQGTRVTLDDIRAAIDEGMAE